MKIAELTEKTIGRLPEVKIEEYSPFRANIIFSLYIYLNEYSKFKKISNSKQDNIVKLIENSIYNETITTLSRNDVKIYENEEFIHHYSDIAYKITSNISKNKKFAEDILKGKYRDIANLSYEEINPEIYREIIENINSRKDNKVEKKTSKLYTCGGCGGKETTVKIYQARSSDEPETKSVTCINCGKKWFM